MFNISMFEIPKKRNICLVLGLAIFLAATGAVSRVMASDLTFTAIDYPGAKDTRAHGINSASDIVGRYISADNQTHGYLRNSRGEFTPIDFPGAVFTVAAGINSHGDIVGMYRLATEPPAVRHWYLLSEGEFTTVDPDGAIFTNALGINSHGDIVGRYCSVAPCDFYGNNFHGFLFKRGEITNIDVPGALATHAWNITAAGLLLGVYKDSDSKFHVFTLDEDQITTIDFPGAYEDGTEQGGINSRGDVVSSYCDTAFCATDNRTEHSFLRTAEGEFESFDVPNAIGTFAYGINQHFEIVGVYKDAQHKNHGFLLNARRRNQEEHDSDHSD